MLKNSRFAGLLRIPGFLPLAGATLMLGVAMSFTAPYLSLFGVERAGMTPFRLGVFMTAIAASGVIASTLAGRWSDATGKHRPLLLASLCAATLGYLCLCVVRDYRLLLAVGIAFIGAGGCALSLVFSFSRAALPATDDAERTFASATLRTILSAAWVFGPAVGAPARAGVRVSRHVPLLRRARALRARAVRCPGRVVSADGARYTALCEGAFRTEPGAPSQQEAARRYDWRS